jgi:hypothetical protein
MLTKLHIQNYAIIDELSIDFTAGLNNGMTAGGANTYNYTIDFFSQMDMVLIIRDGIMSARY